MAKQTFERTLPHFNVGTLGHQGHGKTTLTSAITLARSYRGSARSHSHLDLDRSPDERSLRRTIITSHVEYVTDKLHYAHIDCPGHHAYGRNLFTGAAQLDGAILVVSAQEGVQAQTREHVLLARRAGINQLVVFMSKHYDFIDRDLVEMLEGDVRMLLDDNGYDGHHTPFVRGSAQNVIRDGGERSECIDELLRAMDEHFSLPARDVDLPFEMPIADVLYMSGQGTVVTGSVRRGVVKVGDEVELVGLTDRFKTVVTGIETFNKMLHQAQAGDHVGLKLRGVKREDVHRGQVVAKPGALTPHTKVEASLYFLTKDEGGRSTPIFQGYKPQLHLHTADVPCTLKFSGDTEMIMPGDQAELPMDLMKPLHVEKGDNFVLRDGGRTVALGTITSIIL
jgi:elongation factor Tu